MDHMEGRISTLESKVDHIEIVLEQNTTTHERIFEKLDGVISEMNRRLGELTINGVRTDEKFNMILSDIREMKDKISEITSKPGKRWEGAVMAAVGAIIAGMVGYLFS